MTGKKGVTISLLVSITSDSSRITRPQSDQDHDMYKVITNAHACRYPFCFVVFFQRLAHRGSPISQTSPDYYVKIYTNCTKDTKF